VNDPEQPLVSVVTPFYNTEAYLAEAIESVLAQSYRNFEYLLVNNRSSDGSVAIAERYAARDPRIHLFHNETFVPMLRNYNQALRRISPEARYFKMVQADDAIFPRCLEEMVALAVAHPSVGVVSSYRKVGLGVGPSGLPHEKTVMSGREACRLNLLEDLYLFGSQTTVMVRADIVRARDPFYTEDRYFADSEAVYEILAGHDFAFVHQVLSFSRLDQGSLAGRFKRFNAELLERVMRFKSYGPTYLSPEECQRHLGEHERAYRRYLAESWLRRREPEFWEFHEKGLAAIGETIDRSGFVRDAALVVWKYALSPQVVASALVKRVRRLMNGRAAA
jgi:glycosyltransferase involved in cell wall biosynthesis